MNGDECLAFRDRSENVSVHYYDDIYKVWPKGRHDTYMLQARKGAVNQLVVNMKRLFNEGLSPAN